MGPRATCRAGVGAPPFTLNDAFSAKPLLDSYPTALLDNGPAKSFNYFSPQISCHYLEQLRF